MFGFVVALIVAVAIAASAYSPSVSRSMASVLEYVMLAIIVVLVNQVAALILQTFTVRQLLLS